MGKSKFVKRRSQQQRGGENSNGNGSNRGPQQHNKREGGGAWKDIIRENEKYWTYYREQGLVPEDEWEAFCTALRTDLPVSFRVQGSMKDREFLMKEMEERFFKPLRDLNDETISPPQPLLWYPGAYQTSMSRGTVRNHPLLSKFHNFLVAETEIGNITRQEAVSMIPPLLLRPSADHLVMDMCAAPGSKTSQLVEMMHETNPNPNGMVVANDMDQKRCYMLIHQTLKRFYTGACAVICNDASKMPDIKDKNGDSMRFDRVLCDVICSGDGTMRKNFELWEKWSPQDAIGLHRIQLPIAKRGSELLRIGGLLVYSTCSMNPLEDEAVVAQLLREAKGNLKLVDAHPLLPDLKAKAGVNKWKVMDKDLNVYAKPEDVPSRLQKQLCPSTFPPTEEEANTFNLHYTMRILPHLQDTGGFFIALLEKTGDVDFDVKPYRGPVQKRQRVFKDEPFIFFDKNDPRIAGLKETYGIRDGFPYENLFNRRADGDSLGKQLFYANDTVKEFVTSNMSTASIQSAGMKVFGRKDGGSEAMAPFRLAHEGSRFILPYMTKQKTKISKEDMMHLLQYDAALVPTDTLKAKSEIRANKSGSVVLYVEEDEPVCCWIGYHTVAPYVTKEEKAHLLRVMGVDCTHIEELLKSKRKQSAREAREAAWKEANQTEQNGQGDEKNEETTPAVGDVEMKDEKDDNEKAKTEAEAVGAHDE